MNDFLGVQEGVFSAGVAARSVFSPPVDCPGRTPSPKLNPRFTHKAQEKGNHVSLANSLWMGFQDTTRNQKYKKQMKTNIY